MPLGSAAGDVALPLIAASEGLLFGRLRHRSGQTAPRANGSSCPTEAVWRVCLPALIDSAIGAQFEQWIDNFQDACNAYNSCPLNYFYASTEPKRVWVCLGR